MQKYENMTTNIMLHIAAVITQKCRLPRGMMWSQTNIDLEKWQKMFM